MKHEIIKKANVILGSYGSINAGSKISKAENLCEEFVSSVIEDIVLSVKWSFALKRVDNIDGSKDNRDNSGNNNDFTEITNVSDCIKIAVIVPSNLQFYSEGGKIYFKGGKLTSLFYYSRRIIEALLCNDNIVWKQVPESFKLLAGLNLAAMVAFAMYSDSLFADGLKKQYLIKLEQTRQVYSMGYNLTNSGEV